jgi:hypothetical protein
MVAGCGAPQPMSANVSQSPFKNYPADLDLDLDLDLDVDSNHAAEPELSQARRLPDRSSFLATRF